jgi:uncharacterized OB-fold protein
LAYPPDSLCKNCLVVPPSFEWASVSGRGTLATWTVVRDAFLPGFAGEVPYVVGDVELVEQPGLRVVARLDGVAESNVELGMQVQVAFDDVADGVAVPYFVAGTS